LIFQILSNILSEHYKNICIRNICQINNWRSFSDNKARKGNLDAKT